MPKSKGIPNWLLGCGVGCGALLLVFIALGVGGALFLRETVSGFEDAVEAGRTLDERFGRIEEYTPPPDGSIPPQRIQAFLAIRDFSEPQRERLAEAFNALPLSKDEARELEDKPLTEKLGSVFRITTSAMGLGARIGDFFAARNKAMLEQEMGFGEYTYIYVLAYQSWLKHPPLDGPGGDERDFGMGSRDLQRRLLQMMRNQLEALSGLAEESADWKVSLQAEVEAMQSDRRRLPWQDGLPPPLQASLNPFRDRLEATYNPVANPFELTRNKKRGAWSYTTE